MNMRFLLGPVFCVALVFSSSADPILPFQQPIEQQLTNDLAANPGDKTLNSAHTTYHKTSKSLSTDISILKSLDKSLANVAGYGSLLDTAALDYQNDFLARRDFINQQLVPAPLSANKTSARTSITSLDKSLSNAVHAATTTARITQLQNAANKIISASNAVQRALNTKVGFSEMVAHIGALSMDTGKHGVVAAASIVTSEGSFIGDYNPDEGTTYLNVSGFESGSVDRGITVHVENIVTNVPMTYPLGVGQNFAFYNARDSKKKLDYFFQADPSITNSIVTNAFLSIDFIGTNYLLGSFAFMGTNSAPFDPLDTNTVVTVSQGEFQLNFRH